MNARIQFATPTRPLLIALMPLCFGLLPQLQAVTPAPDGGYPGYNTAEGTSALFSLTSGSHNTAIGDSALHRDTSGSYNTAGGCQALLYDTTGRQNTATGYGTLSDNRTGSFNTAIGVVALLNVGRGGIGASGSNNTAIGTAALLLNSAGSENTAIGVLALSYNDNGGQTSGNGTQNTAVGVKALQNGGGGSNQIGLGYSAGSGIVQSADNITIGNDLGDIFDYNVIRIGDVQTATFIAGIRGATVLGDAIPVVIDSAGHLGTVSSSRRFKKQIEPMNEASETILALKPVTFHYKSDPAGAGPQFGLIAEDVAAVNPDLVVRDKNGEIYTVRYDAVNAMLLSEFLEEHQKVERQAGEMQQQHATIAELKSDGAKEEARISQITKEMESVIARLKEHDSRIQKTSAQIEISKRFARTALNNQ